MEAGRSRWPPPLVADGDVGHVLDELEERGEPGVDDGEAELAALGRSERHDAQLRVEVGLLLEREGAAGVSAAERVVVDDFDADLVGDPRVAVVVVAALASVDRGGGVHEVLGDPLVAVRGLPPPADDAGRARHHVGGHGVGRQLHGAAPGAELDVAG